MVHLESLASNTASDSKQKIALNFNQNFEISGNCSHD